MHTGFLSRDTKTDQLSKELVCNKQIWSRKLKSLRAVSGAGLPHAVEYVSLAPKNSSPLRSSHRTNSFDEPS
jgi:hypothetical protein